MPKTRLTHHKTDKIVKKLGLTAEVLDLEGKVVEEIGLPKEVFTAPIESKLLAQSARVYLANQRQGTSSTKTRGEVAGSTRKIYRQKGTGRARHGSIRAPIFVGGGIVFGPKPRDFKLTLPTKMKKRALFSALTDKFKNKETLIITDLNGLGAKTKAMMEVLQHLKLKMRRGKLAETTLLVVAQEPTSALYACRNIHNLSLAPSSLLSPYLLLTNQKIIFTKKAIESLKKSLWKTDKS